MIRRKSFAPGAPSVWCDVVMLLKQHYNVTQVMQRRNRNKRANNDVSDVEKKTQL